MPAETDAQSDVRKRTCLVWAQTMDVLLNESGVGTIASTSLSLSFLKSERRV